MKLSEKKAVNIFPWRRWDIIFATIMMNLIGLSIPLLVLQLYDRIIPNQSYYTLSVITFGVIVSVFMENILRYSRSNILSWLGMFFEYATSIGAFSHLAKAKYADSLKSGHGKHIENIESVTVLKEFLAGQGFLTLIDLPFVILYLGIIAYLSIPIVIVPIIVLFCFVVSALWVGYKLRKALEKRLDIDDRRYNFVIQILSNHHTMKSMGMEDLILRRYERIHSQCALIEHDINFLSAESRDLSSVFSYLMYCGIICIAAFEVIETRASMGVMAACIMLANRAMQPVQTAMAMWTRMQHFGISKTRIKEIFSLNPEGRETDKMATHITGKISIRDLGFHYPDDDKMIFNHLSVEIQPNQIVSIFGANGVGKTTLTQLILGILESQTGEILIDDHPLASYSFSSLHKQIGYLPPKGILFQGTIMENMTLYQTGPIVDEAMKISRDLGLDPWIQRLPLAYQTKVGDSLFYLLPDGIQQRICLVRTLVNHPKIIILDEANTSLDEQGDYQLNQFLQQQKEKSTIIFITHRPSIENIADASYELIDGELVERQLPMKTQFLPTDIVGEEINQEVSQ